MRSTTLRKLFLACVLLTVSSALAAGPAGTCSTNEQCAKDEFCAKIFDSCGEAGKCEARPQDCMEHGKLLVRPVCGCDGKTYDNACLAAAAGASVKSEGECPAAG